MYQIAHIHTIKCWFHQTSLQCKGVLRPSHNLALALWYIVWLVLNQSKENQRCDYIAAQYISKLAIPYSTLHLAAVLSGYVLFCILMMGGPGDYMIAQYTEIVMWAPALFSHCFINRHHQADVTLTTFGVSTISCSNLMASQHLSQMFPSLVICTYWQNIVPRQHPVVRLHSKK